MHLYVHSPTSKEVKTTGGTKIDGSPLQNARLDEWVSFEARLDARRCTMDGLNVARHEKAYFEEYRLIGFKSLLGRHRTPRRAWSTNIDTLRSQGGSHCSIAMIVLVEECGAERYR